MNKHIIYIYNLKSFIITDEKKVFQLLDDLKIRTNNFLNIHYYFFLNNVDQHIALLFKCYSDGETDTDLIISKLFQDKILPVAHWWKQNTIGSAIDFLYQYQFILLFTNENILGSPSNLYEILAQKYLPKFLERNDLLKFHDSQFLVDISNRHEFEFCFHISEYICVVLQVAEDQGLLCHNKLNENLRLYHVASQLQKQKGQKHVFYIHFNLGRMNCSEAAKETHRAPYEENLENREIFLIELLKYLLFDMMNDKQIVEQFNQQHYECFFYVLPLFFDNFRDFKKEKVMDNSFNYNSEFKDENNNIDISMLASFFGINSQQAKDFNYSIYFDIFSKATQEKVTGAQKLYLGYDYYQ